MPYGAAAHRNVPKQRALFPLRNGQTADRHPVCSSAVWPFFCAGSRRGEQNPERGRYGLRVFALECTIKSKKHRRMNEICKLELAFSAQRRQKSPD